MRLPAAVLVLAAAWLHAQPASIAGLIADPAGKPLAGVHVRLITGDLDRDDAVPTVYGAISDRDGHFSVEGMEPGIYFLMSERAGFLQQTSRASLLTLKPGQHLAGYQIVMVVRALITGQALDEFGDPVSDVQVELQPLKPNQERNFMFTRGSVQTDERGGFRLTAGPGKYYVKASYPRGGARGTPETRTDGTPSAPFTTTFYPNAASTGAASVIEVSAGQELSGVDIHLLRASPGTARTYTVSGVVIGVPENDRANVTVKFGESAGRYYNNNGTSTEADGTFRLTGQQPGYYCVTASYHGGKTALQSRAVEFHLDSADRSGIQLTLAPGEELTGKLEFTGNAPAGEPAKRTVRLQTVENQFGPDGPPAAEVAADGSFRLTGVPPGKFKPVVEPMPENGFLKDVAIDNKSLGDDPLDFTQGVGGSRLKIIISRNGGRVSGRVLDKDGQPVAGLVMVFLARDAKHLDDSEPTRAVGGKFDFKGIHPGKYRILAFDVADLMSAFDVDGDNDALMQKLFDSAEEIEIKEGDVLSKDVPAITKIPEKKEE